MTLINPISGRPFGNPSNTATNREPLSARLSKAIVFFEQLTPESLNDIQSVYAQQVEFKDPFNTVHHRDGVQHIFLNMFQQVNEPKFKVHTAIEQGNQAFLTWDFTFTMKRFKTDQLQRCHGSSHLIFDSNNQIMYHRDYWDAAEELYEKIPILGGFMRWLKKQVD